MDTESEVQAAPTTIIQNKVLLVSYDKQAKLAIKLAQSADEVGELVLEEAPEDRVFNFTTLKPAIDLAKEQGYNIIIAVEPEDNKVSLVVKKGGIAGAFMVLNVHQVAAVLLQNWIKSEKYEGMQLLKSILMSDLLDVVSRKGNVKTIDQVVPLGGLEPMFKETNAKFADAPVAGFNIDQQVMHSDLSFEGIVEQLVLLEGVQRLKDLTIYDALLEVYYHNGFFKEKAVAIDLSLDIHRKQLNKFMSEVRKSPKFLEEIFSVSAVTDFNKGVKKNILTDKVYQYPISGTNILKIETVEGVSISLVPSEEKLTYYISVRESVNSPERFEMANKALDQEIFKLVQYFNRKI